MSRRPHKKSRNGCRECKNRHMKCDETRPVCLNCSTTERNCVYPDKFVASSKNIKPASPACNAVRSPTSQSPLERHEISFPVLPPDQLCEDTVNMAHLDLFNHLVNGDWDYLGISRETFIRLAIRRADTAPYLMYQMLALSAQHLSIESPTREDYYKNQAMRLQNRAIALFNSAIAHEEVTQENCIPFFVFSSALGTHHFCNVLRDSEGNFKSFITSLVNSLNLYQGLLAVANSQWDTVADSELKPIVQAGKDALLEFLEDKHYQPKEIESKRLMQLLEDPMDELDLITTEAAQHAINVFDCLLRFHRGTHTEENYLRGVFAWPTMLKKEFRDKLVSLSPKALIILAHYAVLLYYQRQLWLLGDGGKSIIRSISGNIDPYWLAWLQWPNKEISSDCAMTDTC